MVVNLSSLLLILYHVDSFSYQFTENMNTFNSHLNLWYIKYTKRWNNIWKSFYNALIIYSPNIRHRWSLSSQVRDLPLRESAFCYATIRSKEPHKRHCINNIQLVIQLLLCDYLLQTPHKRIRAVAVSRIVK